ncbi:MAG TPA: hypothetical protein VMV55_06005 [Methanoregula sp.]|nr:hypothetical protein [Methanoregula sp.]
MVISTTENLRALFENIKSLGFFGRLFGWNRIRVINSAAANELNTLDNELNALYEQNRQIQNQLRTAYQDLDHQKSLLANLRADYEILKNAGVNISQVLRNREVELGALKESETKNIQRIADLDKEIILKNFEVQNLIQEKIEKERQLSAFLKADQQKQEQYEHRITELNALKKQLDDDRIRLQGEREDQVRIRFEKMRETWKNHEMKVEEFIRGICSRHQIEYIDKEHVPFPGKPDNTIKIADEYIIFDAKSPLSDDLENFPAYIKAQTEQLKKYVQEHEVNKSLFLVIPTTTLDSIDQLYYNLADYVVYIVTIDTLEPVIMCLKKIEDYEFAEQLSPEERENICRVIGKFAHATKRRIQIDSYFCGEFVNILNHCSCLPDEILTKTISFEKSDKMNPPLEKRAKVISPDQLNKEVRRIRQDADAQDIDVGAGGAVMEKLPLYKTGDTSVPLVEDPEKNE